MNKTILLVIWVIALELLSFVMGQITVANIDPWYTSLTKSALTPPDFLFGMVWGVLYLVLAVVGWHIFHCVRSGEIGTLRRVFAAQLILNLLWTPIFFYFHWMGAALACLVAIVLLTTWFLVLAWQKTQLAFWLMLPYWVWVCFALYLNLIIYLNNI